MRVHWSYQASVRRVIESLAPILQITLSATVSYLFARFVLGHQYPFFAVTVVITALGFSRDARPRRIIETGLGMVLGIAASEVLQLGLGDGLWQLPIILFICLLVARFVTGSNAFTLAAGIQAMLVFINPIPPGGPFVRTIDALVGGVVALLATALIPRDPRGLAAKDASKLFEVFLETLAALRLALTKVDHKIADEALKQVRRTQPLVDNWRLSLDSAVAISRVSPFMRKYRDELTGHLRLLRAMDLATRNLRVVVRRVDFLIRDGQKREYLAKLIQEIHDASIVLAEGYEDSQQLAQAQMALLEVMHQLDPKRFGIADNLAEASALLLLRPLLVDLLCASGMSEDDARAELPTI